MKNEVKCKANAKVEAFRLSFRCQFIYFSFSSTLWQITKEPINGPNGIPISLFINYLSVSYCFDILVFGTYSLMLAILNIWNLKWKSKMVSVFIIILIVRNLGHLKLLKLDPFLSANRTFFRHNLSIFSTNQEDLFKSKQINSQQCFLAAIYLNNWKHAVLSYCNYIINNIFLWHFR